LHISDIKKLPYPGFRQIKTGIAVLICLLFYNYINREGVTFAAIAILMCMQDSVEKSVKEGINRAIGTILGALFGIAFVYSGITEIQPIAYLFLCAIGVVVYIYICNLMNLRNSITIGCVVFLIIAIGSIEGSPAHYSINRTIDTIVGIIIAVVVNRSMFAPKPERFKPKSKSNNPQIIYDFKKQYQCNSYIWSGGTSTELYIYPRTSIESDRDFDFRISTSNINLEHSTLAKFKGYMRDIMLLEGDMKLSHEGFHTVTLDRFSQDFFKGDWETEAFGQCVDLNLIYKKEYAGGFEPLAFKDKINFNVKKLTGFYCLGHKIKIKVNSSKDIEVLNYILEPKDFIFFRDDKNDTQEEYSIQFEKVGEKSIEDSEVVVIKADVWKKEEEN